MKEYQIISDSDALRKQVSRDFPGYNVVFDDNLKLPAAYLDMVRNRTKTTTIKFREKTLRLPRAWLGVVPVSDRFEGRIPYKKVVVKSVAELDATDAKNDGFSTLKGLQRELRKAYGEIPSDSLVVIHYFG